MFKTQSTIRKIADMQEEAQQELLQKINDILIAGGYFRARLNTIEPFDKILGGMCWSIAGSNFDIDIEFQDDLNMGQKIKLSEKVVAALKQMECPLALAPQQIQGLDYAKIFPVIQWLVKKLMESRDNRGDRNKKQAIMNYKLKFVEKAAGEAAEDEAAAAANTAKSSKNNDIQKIKEIVFRGKPKRVFRSNRKADVAFHDPKRVHTALREFNDMSANKVFQAIIEQIAQFENEEKAKLQQFQKIAAKSGQAPTANAALDQMTQEEVMANVERMLQSEKQSAKALPKVQAAAEFDMNEGIVSVKATPAASTGGVKPPASRQTAVEPAKAAAKVDLPQAETRGQTMMEHDQTLMEEESTVLDQEIQLIRRKTLAVRTDNVQEAFMTNIDEIAETVQGFQKMSEEQFQNDAVFIFQSEKENYEKELAKLQKRLEKTAQQRQELAQVSSQVQSELEQLEYERDQYQQQVKVVSREAEDVEAQIERSSVKEHEIMVVTALIDEKARLNEEKVQLRRNCREEKSKLEQELERMRKRREDMEKEEAAEVLRQIDSEFDQEHQKLLDQRKQIADVNRNITVIQRRIENCPSKIEITQFHKRLVELFDNLNLKSEENRRYVNLYNTVMETRRLFRQQTDYMKEINDSYKGCKQKKEKEVLLHNIQNVLKIIDQSITQSTEAMSKLRVDYQRVQAQYNESILREKDHYKRIKEFEDECDKNDELRAKLKK